MASWGPKHISSSLSQPHTLTPSFPIFVHSYLSLYCPITSFPFPISLLFSHLAHPSPQLTLPRVEKLSWKRKERISTRSMPRL